jgi:hypothetical protein
VYILKSQFPSTFTNKATIETTFQNAIQNAKGKIALDGWDAACTF